MTERESRTVGPVPEPTTADGTWQERVARAKAAKAVSSLSRQGRPMAFSTQREQRLAR